MSIAKRLAEDMKQALKAKETRRLNCIRMLRSKLQEKTVELRAKHGPEHELTDDEAVEVIGAYAKQRRDSISAYREAGREEQAADEQAELDIVTAYLPEQLTDEALRQIVKEAVASSGAVSAKDIGAVMKIVMPQVKGRADGKQVNAIARELLG